MRPRRPGRTRETRSNTMTMINVNEHGAVSLNGEIIGWVRHDDGPQENDTWAQAVAAGLRWHAIPRGPVGLPQAHHVTFGQAVDALVAIRACDCPEDATGPWDCMDCPV